LVAVTFTVEEVPTVTELGVAVTLTVGVVEVVTVISSVVKAAQPQ
jgi:hypothetical protein